MSGASPFTSGYPVIGPLDMRAEELVAWSPFGLAPGNADCYTGIPIPLINPNPLLTTGNADPFLCSVSPAGSSGAIRSNTAMNAAPVPKYRSRPC